MKNKLLVRVFKLLIIISIVFKSIQLLVRLYSIVICNFVLRGDDSYRSKFNFIFEERKIETVVSYFIIPTFMILFSVWFYIKYKQAHKQSSLTLAYKPIWSLFCFVIPIFNLFAPYRIMNDLWTVYNRDMLIEKWGKNQIKIWWILSILIVVCARFIYIKFGHASDIQGFILFESFTILLYAIMIHYYLLLYKLVKLLSK